MAACAVGFGELSGDVVVTRAMDDDTPAIADDDAVTWGERGRGFWLWVGEFILATCAQLHFATINHNNGSYARPLPRVHADVRLPAGQADSSAYEQALKSLSEGGIPIG